MKIFLILGIKLNKFLLSSADFDMLGDKIISCGMDHSLKIWNFGDQKIQDAVQLSYKVQGCSSTLI